MILQYRTETFWFILNQDKDNQRYHCYDISPIEDYEKKGLADPFRASDVLDMAYIGEVDNFFLYPVSTDDDIDESPNDKNALYEDLASAYLIDKGYARHQVFELSEFQRVLREV